MLLGIGGVVVLVFLTDLTLAALEPHVVDLPAGRVLWRVGRMVITLGLNTLLFAVIYKTLPRALVRWRAALGGALLVAVAWEAGQYALTAFLIGEKFSAYGVVGSFMAVMLWLYYGSAAVFFGAEVVQSLGQELKSRRAALSRTQQTRAGRSRVIVRPSKPRQSKLSASAALRIW